MKQNLREFLRKNMELAIHDFNMIQPGDRILVGISGGADSFTLLQLLTANKIHVTNDISVVAAHLDLGFNPENEPQLIRLQSYFEQHGYEYYIGKSEIGPLAHSDYNRLNPCFMCSRMRRKRIFEIAHEQGCNKIAYGHHKDDIVETLLLNIFFGREISTMKPNQEFFQGRFYIIRPLAYIWEKKIKTYAASQNFPLFENICPTNKNSKRQYIKDLLNNLEKDHRIIKENIFKSLKHVKVDYLLK